MRFGQISAGLAAIRRIRAENTLERAHRGDGILAFQCQTTELCFGIAVEWFDRDEASVGVLSARRVARGGKQFRQLSRRLDVGVVDTYRSFERANRASGVLLLDGDLRDDRVRIVGAGRPRDDLRGTLERSDRTGAVLG